MMRTINKMRIHMQKLPTKQLQEVLLESNASEITDETNIIIETGLLVLAEKMKNQEYIEFCNKMDSML